MKTVAELTYVALETPLNFLAGNYWAWKHFPGQLPY